MEISYARWKQWKNWFILCKKRQKDWESVKVTCMSLLGVEMVPVLKLGKRLVIPKEKFVRWINEEKELGN